MLSHPTLAICHCGCHVVALVMGPWQALEGEGVSIGKKIDRVW